VTIDQWGEKTAAAFLGIRLECAQCHKHPFDRWTQADYRAYANLFAQVTFGESPEAQKTIRASHRHRLQAVTPARCSGSAVFVGARQLLAPARVERPPPGPRRVDSSSRRAERRVELWHLDAPADNPFCARFNQPHWGHLGGHRRSGR
jgi:hypothetical protein